MSGDTKIIQAKRNIEILSKRNDVLVSPRLIEIVVIESKRGERGRDGQSAEQLLSQVSALEVATQQANDELSIAIQQVNDANGIKTNDW